jgi:hypothetical protein
MQTNYGKALKGFKPREHHVDPPIDALTWYNHVSAYFRADVEPSASEALGEFVADRAQDFTEPTLSYFEGALHRAIARLDPASSAGLDGIPAAFVKHAFYVTDTRPVGRVHVLRPLLAGICFKAFTTGHIPTAWQASRIKPIYKKGDEHSPENYRLLAICSVLYRLYANCLRDLTTQWIIKHNHGEGRILPDTQFGFFPKRSCQQAHFVLRHLVRHQQTHQGVSKNKRVYTMFVDFKGAYDSISRESMWQHFRCKIGLPPTLLTAIQSLYLSDMCVVQTGQNTSPVIRPEKGVRQGCPLSPLLFSLFVNDVGQHIDKPHNDGSLAGVLSTPNDNTRQAVSFVMYADDLTLFDTSVGRLQVLVDRLVSYAHNKGLTVNVQKCAVMVFKTPRMNSSHTQIYFSGQVVPQVKRFKFLGLWLTETMNMRLAVIPLKFAAYQAWRLIKTEATKKGLHHMPHVMLRLLQTYVLPSLMNCCQSWGPELLRRRELLSNDLQKVMLSFYRTLLGVRTGVPSSSLLDEVGAVPLQLYWLGACLKFWNSLFASDNSMLRNVALSDMRMAGSFPSCGGWFAEFALSLNSAQVHVQLTPDNYINIQQVETAWESSWRQMRTEEEFGDPLDKETKHRPLAVYNRWFRMFDLGGKAKLHLYLSAGNRIPMAHVFSMARLRLGSHGLRVDRGRWEGGQHLEYEARTCKRCNSDSLVDNEYHALFVCPSTACVRQDFPDIVQGCCAENPELTMRSLMAFSDVKRMASFVFRCLREAVLPLRD